MIDHIVMFSGGVASWAAAKRVASIVEPGDKLTLLFADTLMEDEDLYRFIAEASVNIQGELVTLCEGRTPWEIFNDVRFLGNTRIDPCSRILKRKICRDWLEDNCDPESTIVYLGLDFTEMHRLNADRWTPWKISAPLFDPPYMMKEELIGLLKNEEIAPPRLYKMGFPHNNCGGFCIKAGHAHFALLLKVMPDRFAYHEEHERRLRKELGKDVSILRDRKGGDTKPMTLEEFRIERENEIEIDSQHAFDWGGCGCFSESE